MKFVNPPDELWFVLILCALFQTAQGQDKLPLRTDFQSWHGASLKLDLRKGWAITGQYQLRMVDNSARYKGLYLYGQADKRLNEHFALIANYRLAMVDKGTYHRYALGLEARRLFGNIQVQLRPMVYYQQQNFSGDKEGQTDTDSYFRPRLTTKYALSRRFDVYAYTEPVFKIDNSYQLDRWRNSVGVKYEYAKNQRINLYYLWQTDYSHKKYDLVKHIVGLDLEILTHADALTIHNPAFAACQCAGTEPKRTEKERCQNAHRTGGGS